MLWIDAVRESSSLLSVEQSLSKPCGTLVGEYAFQSQRDAVEAVVEDGVAEGFGLRLVGTVGVNYPEVHVEPVFGY